MLGNQFVGLQTRWSRMHEWQSIHGAPDKISVFSSLFMCGRISPVESDFERQSQRKNYFKNGFSFAGGHLPCRKIYLVKRSSVLFPGFLYWSGIILFFLRSFSYFFLPIFDRESFFSFSFLSFHFFLFDLWLGIRILAFVIRSPLRRFYCPLLRVKEWGFLFYRPRFKKV